MKVNRFIARIGHCTAVVALLFLLGCDSNDLERHTPEIVVESYLVAGEPVAKVRVSQSASTQKTYDFTENAVTGAEVMVIRLDANGAAEEVTRFVELDEQPGLYWPTEENTVVAGKSYRLEVNPRGFPLVTSTTFVPGAFELVRNSADTLVYQGSDQFELDVTRSEFPGRQSIFIFATESLNPIGDLLTPFYRDITGDSEDDLASLRITESPLINEGNYDVNEDGTLTIKLPWIAVAFYGPNRLTANAVDDNMYDFIRSQTVQQGGSTLAPGEIPNVLNRVEGGTGIFGSLARSIVDVEVIPPSQ
ncbi:MAG: DUF4249 family protein [Rhodothermales bacterium]